MDILDGQIQRSADWQQSFDREAIMNRLYLIGFLILAGASPLLPSNTWAKRW